MVKFTVSEALRYGWQATKEHLPFLVVVILITLAIQFVPNILIERTREATPLISGLITIVFWIIAMLLSLGGIKISLKIVDGQSPQIADLLNAYPRLFAFMISTIIYAVLVGVGLILLIIPGVIFAVKYHFYSYLILDKSMGPLEALKKSGELTKGSRMTLFFLGIATLFLNIGGALLLGIGLFVTIPVSMLAYAHVYRKLLA